jgi:hypothetical protein
MGPNKNKARRPNFTSEEVEQMRQEEAAGKSRRQIAADHNTNPAAVTRRLGAVRPYRQRRRGPETLQIDVKSE